jgi:hypothetical protein
MYFFFIENLLFYLYSLEKKLISATIGDELVESQISCHSREGGNPEHDKITGFPLSRE